MAETKYRTGDKIAITGSYQHRALHEGNTVQRWWHRLKLQTAADMAALSTGSRVLDIGCGSGIITEFLPQAIAYTGVDSNPDALSFARAQYPQPHLQFLYWQIDDIHQMNADAYAAIFFLETIEHIHPEQAKKTMMAIKELLAKNGCCIITTPNRKSAWPLIEKLMDFFRLAPKLGGEQHEHLFTKKELVAMANVCGLQVSSVKTFNGIAPWLSWLGAGITLKIHKWELRNNWFPGSLIAMRLQVK